MCCPRSGIADACLARELPDGSLMLVDGHLRTETMPDAVIPVLVLDMTEDEADKILATLDPLAAMAGADSAKLDALLREVQTGNEALADMLTDLAEESGVLDESKKEIFEDEIPEPPAEAITKPGDLWLLGDHRLLCGDSTDVNNLARLMADARVQCIVTDPPYGVSQAAKNRLINEAAGGKGGAANRNEHDIVDDDLSPDELKKRLLPTFNNIRQHVMADDCTLFVTAPQGGELCMMMMEAKLQVRHVLIWKKNCPTFSMGRLDYDYQHEPILLTWGKRHKRPMRGKHKTSVWEINKPRKSEEHPTMKPVELYANAYQNNSDNGDSVFDAYSGSGTAFIAAEQLGRKCYGMEISPQYCDVIVKRWETLTGKKAVLDEPAKSDRRKARKG